MTMNATTAQQLQDDYHEPDPANDYLVGNPDLLQLLDTWVYVSESKSFVPKHKPNDRPLNTRTFDEAYEHLHRVMPHDQRINHVGRVSPSRYLSVLNAETNRVVRTGFTPNASKIFTDELGIKTLNEWTASSVPASKGDVTPFYEYLRYLMNEIDEQCEFFLQYLAHMVTYPEKKIGWMPVISSKARGLGKNFFYDQVIKPLLGESNCEYLDSPQYITGSFDDWKISKTFICLDEVLQTGNRNFIEKLKPLITNHETAVNPKGKPQYQMPNYMNFIMFSNHRSAMQIDEGERRFFVVHNTQDKWSSEKFGELAEWLRSGGINHVKHYLLNDVDLSDFDHTAPPIVTEDMTQAIESTKCEVQMLVEELVRDSKGPFDVNCGFTLKYIKKLVAEHRDIKHVKFKAYTVNNALNECGMMKLGKYSMPDGKRLDLYGFCTRKEFENYRAGYIQSCPEYGDNRWYNECIYDGRDLSMPDGLDQFIVKDEPDY